MTTDKEANAQGETAPGSEQPAQRTQTRWEQTAEKLGGIVTLYRKRARELRGVPSFDAAGRAEAERLDSIADDLEQLGISTELDFVKQEVQVRHEDWLKARQHQRDWVIENTRQTVQLGLSAIRTTVLINGGALVALLAFLGNVWAKSGPVAAFSVSFRWFAIGLLVATLTLAFSYVAQFCYGISDDSGTAIPKWLRVGKGFHIGALVFFVAALATFAAGCFASFSALKTAEPPPLPAVVLPSKETTSDRSKSTTASAPAAVSADQGTRPNDADAASSGTTAGPAASDKPADKEIAR